MGNILSANYRNWRRELVYVVDFGASMFADGPFLGMDKRSTRAYAFYRRHLVAAYHPVRHRIKHGSVVLLYHARCPLFVHACTQPGVSI